MNLRDQYIHQLLDEKHDEEFAREQAERALDDANQEIERLGEQIKIQATQVSNHRSECVNLRRQVEDRDRQIHQMGTLLESYQERADGNERYVRMLAEMLNSMHSEGIHLPGESCNTIAQAWEHIGGDVSALCDAIRKYGNNQES